MHPTQNSNYIGNSNHLDMFGRNLCWHGLNEVLWRMTDGKVEQKLVYDKVVTIYKHVQQKIINTLF